MNGSHQQLPERFVSASTIPPANSFGDFAQAQRLVGDRSRYVRRRRGGIGLFFRFMAGSVRTQPLLTILIFIITGAFGFVWWWATPARWEVDSAIIVAQPQPDEFLAYLGGTAQKNIAANASISLNAAQSSNPGERGFRFLSARDVGDLFTTSAMVDKTEREILKTLETEAAVRSDRSHSILDLLTESVIGWHEYIRGAGAAAVHKFTSIAGLNPTRVTESDALNKSSRSDAPVDLRIELIPFQSDGDKVLRLHLSAGHPLVAEQASSMLVKLARDRLSEFESATSLQHLAELQPKSKAAQNQFEEAQEALDQFKAELKVNDPTSYAADLERRLSDSFDATSALETEITEAETERRSVMNQIEQMKTSGEAFVIKQVTAENPRILDIRREISELRVKYDSLVDFTAKHPEKVSLQNQIDRKKTELDALPPTIVVEDVREPNPAFSALQQHQFELDRKISQYAGREVGLRNEIASLRTELNVARIQAAGLASLQSTRDEARASFEQINEQLSHLITKIAQSRQFQHIQLMETPRVRSRILPDSPKMLGSLAFTLGLSVFLALSLPMFRAAAKSKIVTRAQVEILSRDLPIVIVGDIPDRPIRKLLPAQ